MQSYYGTTNSKWDSNKLGQKSELSKDKNLKTDSPSYKSSGFISCCKQTFVVLSAILGVLSLALIIALNAANLVEIYRNKNEASQFNSATAIMLKGIDDIQKEVKVEVKPKLDNINTATTVSIPSLIGSHSKLLQSDIIKYCSPRYDNEGKDCPVKFNPVHSARFSLWDPWKEHSCIQDDGYYDVTLNITFYPFISFIPSPTSLDGCSKHPSFSLSENLYSYSHTSMIRRCSDQSQSTQYWTLGTIKADQGNKPFFENVISWPLIDRYDRKLCSTVAGTKGGWLACSIAEVSEEADYNTTGVEPIMIMYMDVFGLRKEWVYNEDEIFFDRKYDALYFSLGPGIIKNDKVYFLIYGSLREDWDEPAYCSSPRCVFNNESQQVCNAAQRPPFYKFHQVVNGILEFRNNPLTKPELIVRTIPPHNYDLGALGRLYYFPFQNKVMIYKKSSSWHSYLFFGTIDLEGDLSIHWYPIQTITRPGSSTCPGNNHCPRVCVTGTYNDYFPIGRDANLGVTLMLRNYLSPLDPSIRIASKTRIFLNHSLRKTSQRATDSTTTCFKFNGIFWCLQIVVMEPGTIGTAQPVAVLFPLQYQCVNTTRSQVNELGSGEMDNVNSFENGYFLV